MDGAQVKKRRIRIAAVLCLVLSAVLCLWGWKAGIFRSRERLSQFINGFGSAGPVVFTLLQAVQVVFPILPGGIGCLAGVLMFGALRGFLFNYIGICAGSIAAFLVARHAGKPILGLLFSEKQIARYEQWTKEKNRFARMFAIAIFLPVAPDDFLCYLAGTTSMKLGQFTRIILLGKPAAIALYSLGLATVFRVLVPGF